MNWVNFYPAFSILGALGLVFSVEIIRPKFNQKYALWLSLIGIGLAIYFTHIIGAPIKFSSLGWIQFNEVTRFFHYLFLGISMSSQKK